VLKDREKLDWESNVSLKEVVSTVVKIYLEEAYSKGAEVEVLRFVA